MRLNEWTFLVMVELRLAGFDAVEYQGFPLVPTPPGSEKLRLIQIELSYAVEKIIYAEGMLLLPYGACA